jgi:hypothetical protein
VPISISGENERWPPPGAQPRPAPRSGPIGGKDATATASRGNTGAAGASNPNADGLSFAMIAFGGAGAGSAAKVANQGNGTPATAARASSEASTPCVPGGTNPTAWLPTEGLASLSTVPETTDGVTDTTGSKAPGRNTPTPNPGYNDGIRQQFARSAYGVSPTPARGAAPSPAPITG